MNNKIFFILSMRRAGSSVLKTLVSQHPEVQNIEFEPNELFEICERIEISRYKHVPYFNETLERFKNRKGNWYGAKLVTNPGIEGMRWKNFDPILGNPHYIFTKRNAIDCYNSWIGCEKSRRGICSYEMYLDWYTHLNNSFEEFVQANPERSCILCYENLVENANEELKKVWKTLKLNIPNIDFNSQMRKPKDWNSKLKGDNE